LPEFFKGIGRLDDVPVLLLGMADLSAPAAMLLVSVHCFR
jgi:uncharacterized membrane protein YkvA (DUF1232 family)